MRAALVEQDDFAAGTSSRSSRLIHGGLRYLEQFRFGLVREALAERSQLLTLAPHLVRIEPLLFPIYGIPFLLEGVLRRRADPLRHPRRAPRRRLAPPPVEGGDPRPRADAAPGRAARRALYHDGVEDDARYTLAVVRTALGGRRRGGHPGPGDRPRREARRRRPAVLRAADLATGADLEIRTRAVVDATGVWAAEPDHPFGGGTLRILPSRGAHLVVPRERIPNQTGLTIRVPGKVVFLVPWPDYWLIGTTDALFEGPAARPAADGWEVDKLLDTVNATMDVDLEREDVVGTFAGLRPLIAPSDGSTVKASREHRVTVESDGVVRIGGGKYTTYRVMARDVIDAVLGREDGPGPADRTPPTGVWSAPRRPTRWPDRGRARDDPGRRLGRPGRRRPAGRPPRHGGTGGRRARCRAATCSGPRARPAVPRGGGRLGRPARARRSRSTTSWPGGCAWRSELPDRGAAIAPRVAAILGAELGWGESRQALEVQIYLASAGREFAVPGAGGPAPAVTSEAAVD